MFLKGPGFVYNNQYTVHSCIYDRVYIKKGNYSAPGSAARCAVFCDGCLLSNERASLIDSEQELRQQKGRPDELLIEQIEEKP